MYSLAVSLVLVCMIVTGAVRSVAVKFFYQMGYDFPLLVTLLYLVGQSLSLVVYIVSITIKAHNNKQFAGRRKSKGGKCYAEYDDERDLEAYSAETSIEIEEDDSQASLFDAAVILSDAVHHSELQDLADLFEGIEATVVEPAEPSLSGELDKPPAGGGGKGKNDASSRPVLKRSGSLTGLSEESKEAVQWVHRVPWYLKPALPGFCNLCNTAMRWGSLVYLPASVAEIMISGLELVLSVYAARIVRKRMVSWTRWTGVAVVAVGVALVGAVDAAGALVGLSVTSQLVGMLLVVGQCVMSVMQDIAEEVFMDEADFPATLLLGMEGLFGLAFGVVLYVPVTKLLGEDPAATLRSLSSSPFGTMYAIMLPFLFTLTGIFNIVATGVTSSMTRNVWKNLRTVLVWVFSLMLYYCTVNDELGEPWVVPGSLYVLGGFVVILSGIYVYYTNP
jgi:hypothetical protein